MGQSADQYGAPFPARGNDPSGPGIRYRPAPFVWLLIIVLASFASSAIGISLRTGIGSISEIWLANALGVALLMNGERRRRNIELLSFLTGCGLANAAFSNPPLATAFFALCNGIEVFAALLLFDLFIGRGRHDDGQETAFQIFLRLAFAAGVAPAFAATIATLALPLIGGTPSVGFFSAWWGGSAMGAVAILPIRFALTERNFSIFRTSAGVPKLLIIATVSLLVPLLAINNVPFPFVVIMQPLLFGALLTNPLMTSIASAITIGTIIASVTSGHALSMQLGTGNLGSSVNILAALTVMAPILVSFLVEDRQRESDVVAQIKNRWAFALEGAHQGVWDVDLTSGRAYWSPIWKKIVGYDGVMTEEQANDWIELVHPDDRQRVDIANRACIDGLTDNFEQIFRMRHRDGRWIWIMDRGTVLGRDDQGRALRMIGTHTDITEQKEAEYAIRSLSERVTLATRTSGVGIWEWDMDADRVIWDDQMLALYGMSRETFSGSLCDWAARLHPDDVDQAVKLFGAMTEESGTLDALYRVITPKGDVRYIQAMATIVRSADNDRRIMVGTNRDVTEAHLAAESLRLANEGLNQFAALASHDLQAPLRHMSLYAELLQEELGKDASPAIQATLKGISSSADTMRQLVRSLLQFSRTSRANPERRLTPLSDIIDQVRESLAVVISESGALIRHASLPRLSIDPVLFMQVFQNLIENAIRYRSQAAPVVDISVTETDDSWQISVKDNGIGIDPVYADVIFQPFRRLQTSKDQGGNGIGLSLVRRIVHAHGGRIFLDTDQRTGARFVISMPKISREVAPMSATG